MNAHESAVVAQRARARRPAGPPAKQRATFKLLYDLRAQYAEQLVRPYFAAERGLADKVIDPGR
jgi:acetyl-CoA carboxylase carboxyltransferase component